jgi:ribulose-phosphate 3-epimerase
MSASAISADPLAFFEALPRLKDFGIGKIHFDVMDGVFVPRFGLFPELLAHYSKLSHLPIEVHLMVTNPNPYFTAFGDDCPVTLIPHIESLIHPHHALLQIRDLGFIPGIAINPGTPLQAIEPLIDELEIVTLMGINPGIVGHKLIPSTINRIKNLKEILDSADNQISLEVDGGVTLENAMSLIAAGADTLVCGAGTIFKPEKSIQANISELYSKLHSN